MSLQTSLSYHYAGVWNIYMCYIYLRGYLFNVADMRRCFSSFIWNENQEETDSERLRERKIDMKRYSRARRTLRTDISQCAVYASIWFCVRRFFFNSPVNLIKESFEADTSTARGKTFAEGFLGFFHRRHSSSNPISLQVELCKESLNLPFTNLPHPQSKRNGFEHKHECFGYANIITESYHITESTSDSGRELATTLFSLQIYELKGFSFFISLSVSNK